MSPFRISNPRFLAEMTLESVLIFGVLYGLALLTVQLAPQVVHSDVALHVAASTTLFAGSLYATRRARLGDETNLRREFVLVCLISAFLGALAFFLYWALFDSTRNLSSFLMLEGAIAVPASVTAWRWLVSRYRILGICRERIMILGTGEAASQACRWIVQGHGSDYVVVGFADEDASRLGSVIAMGVRVQTDFESLPQYCERRVDRIVLALDEKRGKLPIFPLMQLRLAGTEIEDSTSFFERTSGKIAVENMLPSWLIFSEGFHSSAIRSFGKRATDIAASLTLLAVSAPVMAMVALLVKVDSRGPVLYRQERVGRGGRPFRLLKFRSMVRDAEKLTGPTWASHRDPRVTRSGRVLRTLRLDELPQLFNVLRGEMSFVGPRPERPHFVRQLEDTIPYYSLRVTVRPGITGWAQVCYRYGANVEDALEKLKYDLYYIKNYNLLFDVWIILKTVRVVLLGSGAH
jgi:sugar transferase (PEP-CTERM system associated)